MSQLFTPRPYQTMIRDHILDVPRCAIWAGMGMGKTTSTLNALDGIALVDDSPVLVLAPKRVALSTWPDEARKWEHLRGLSIMPVVGSEAERKAALRMDAQIYTTNYENIEWLVAHWGERWPYRTVVADESTKLKSLRLSVRTSKTGKEFLAGQGGVRAKALGRDSSSSPARPAPTACWICGARCGS
jgi:hypothetical protein